MVYQCRVQESCTVRYRTSKMLDKKILIRKDSGVWKDWKNPVKRLTPSRGKYAVLRIPDGSL